MADQPKIAENVQKTYFYAFFPQGATPTRSKVKVKGQGQVKGQGHRSKVKAIWQIYKLAEAAVGPSNKHEAFFTRRKKLGLGASGPPASKSKF